MKRFLLALLLFFPTFLSGQNVIKGVVVDSLTQEPLPSATVYVNGTTQGTITDNDGRFELKDVSFPATVVFSFVGYQPQAHGFTRNPGTLTINLKTNDELPEIEVSGKGNKVSREDMDYFKAMFLGDDRWGRQAKIKNENVLLFDRSFHTSYHTRRIGKRTFSKVSAQHEKAEKYEEFEDTVKVVSSVFDAWAYEPLIIDLPLLGYELYVDLEKFTVEQVNNVTSCNMLGYFYYKPYENLKKTKTAVIEKNRQKAYYGSSQHFLRSLAQDCLRENGYILTMPETVSKGRKNLLVDLSVDVAKYSSGAGDNLIRIHGLKDKKLKIRYYHRGDGAPMNFKERGKGIYRYSESGISFLEDNCIFLKEGIVIDNNIRFTGDISKKRVGASLPGDYFPDADTNRTYATQADYADELMKFADNINEFNFLFPQEKVYLEFDNTAYFQGENIWFKAFVTNATTLERAPSGVLYVDFLAPTGQLLRQEKLKVEAGQADGAIPLLNAGTIQTREKQGVLAYPSGFYEIRAYTQNMLDFSPEAIFSRVIPVYTQPKYEGEYDRSRVKTSQDNQYIEDLRNEYIRRRKQRQDDEVKVAFYPEGGSLVKGLPCRVAFKATGSDAFGVEGALVVPGVWDSVRTVFDGMGSFIITPQGFVSADFFPEGGEKKAYLHLPDVITSGYSMISDMLSDSQLQINIWRTQDRIYEQAALVVTCRGQVIYFEEIKDVENSQLMINCSDWPVGVCRLTLFNKEGMILSSRSIFHNSSESRSPTITVNTDSMSRQSCDKEVMEFKLTDTQGNPFRDRFCLSVRDATDYGGGQTDNLQTNLLLSSDLRGYIHDPAWYLECYDDERREALNLLTLVQGWERYEWKTMTGLEDFNERHRIEEGLTMNGWILSYGRREPVSDIGVYASLVPDDDNKLFESFDYQTDSTGYFGFDLSDFYGNAKFTVNLMTTKQNGDTKLEKSKRIRFERAERPAPRPFLKQETDLAHNNHRVYDYKVDYTDFDLTPEQRRKLGRMIDDVDIEEEGEKRRFIDYDTFTSFEAEEDAELELDMGEYTSNVEEYFKEQGIQFSYGIMPEEPIFGDLKIKWVNPIWYVHNREKELYLKPFDKPLEIDMIDVKSIILYDKSMTERQMQELAPLKKEPFAEMSNNNDEESSTNSMGFSDFGNDGFNGSFSNDAETMTGQMASSGFDNGGSGSFANLHGKQLVDILIKDDKELLFYSEIRNLGHRSTTVKGFTRPVEYYSPVYPDGPIEGVVDYRRTLYWNPNVITDENGHARVEFYNNSFTRKFTINAAGITASGIPYILNQNW